jgi:hypothetical protein
LAFLIQRESRRYAFEWRLLVAIVETESNFRPNSGCTTPL